MQVNGSYRPKIIIAEPLAEIRESLLLLFGNNGYECFVSTTGPQTLEMVKAIRPELLVLEVALPQTDGIEVSRELKSTSGLEKTLIVFYTDRNEDYSQIAAFNAGADDYVIKPVKNNVFITRINALLKRSLQPDETLVGSNTNGAFIIDRERYCIIKEGREIVLPRKEFELLSLLFSKPKKVFSRQDISDKIWGYEMSHKNRTIDVHVRKLREKLGDRHIKTVKGIGYSFEL